MRIGRARCEPSRIRPTSGSTRGRFRVLPSARRTKDGQRTDELVIVVYVDRKRPRNKVRKPVPPRIRIPRLGTFETDVVAIGRLEPLVFADHVRPAMPGCSIGHVDLDGYGTFGLLVKMQAGAGAGLFILSNSHVLALDGLAAVGDDIVQPGPADIDGESGKIAKLANMGSPSTSRKPAGPTSSMLRSRVSTRSGNVTNASARSTSFPSRRAP